MNKVSLILGILLVLAIGVAGYFWLQGQQVKQEFQDFIAESYGPDDDMITSTPIPAIQDETSNWLTVTSTNYGYSLKIPSGWGLRSALDDSYIPLTGNFNSSGSDFIFSSDASTRERVQVGPNADGTFHLEKYNLDTPEIQIKPGKGDVVLDKIAATFQPASKLK